MTFDPAKSRINRQKHGIDLADVEGVFFDDMALTREDRDHPGDGELVRTDIQRRRPQAG